MVQQCVGSWKGQTAQGNPSEPSLGPGVMGGKVCLWGEGGTQ